MLVPDQPIRLLALGHTARMSAPASVHQLVEPLTAINYLVVGAGGDVHQMMEAVGKIKEKNPLLKVANTAVPNQIEIKISGDSCRLS